MFIFCDATADGSDLLSMTTKGNTYGQKNCLVLKDILALPTI